MTRTRSYWIIMAGETPTAFRSKDRESLEPTLHQLQRTQPDVLLRWFEGHRLWDTPEAAAEARERQGALRKVRGKSWRPGGAHRDPREKYQLTRDQKRARFKTRLRNHPSDPIDTVRHEEKGESSSRTSRPKRASTARPPTRGIRSWKPKN